MTERYRIVNCEKLNVREKPSINSNVICTLNKGESVLVVNGYSKQVIETNNATNETKSIKWYKVKIDKHFYYMSSTYLKKIDYLSLCSDAADTVYKKIVEIGCEHKSGAKSFKQIKSKKVTTCGTGASAVMQIAGLLDEGKIVSHTSKVGEESNCMSKKNTITKAIIGVSNIKEGTCSIVRIGTTYSKMNSKYKKKGIIYIYNSTISVNAGNDYIYSLLDTSYQKKNGRYTKVKLKGNYYPFNHKIIYAIVPNS